MTDSTKSGQVIDVLALARGCAKRVRGLVLCSTTTRAQSTRRREHQGDGAARSVALARVLAPAWSLVSVRVFGMRFKGKPKGEALPPEGGLVHVQADD
jgi:hypothetical protein